MSMRMLFLFISLSLLAGCMNAVTYHHSERLSIATIESKATDVQQPLQGNVGLKYRTILVAPGKKQATAGVTSDLGESTSVISDFNLIRKPNGLSSTTTITSAFITGDAAIAAPAATAAAISGVGSSGPSDTAVDRAELLRQIMRSLEGLKNDGDKVAKNHIADLDHLAGALKDLTSDIASRQYYDLSGTTISSNNSLVGKYDFSNTTPRFIDAINYEADLRGQLSRIEKIEADFTRYKLAGVGSSLTVSDMKAIKTRKKEIREELRQFFNRVGSSALIDSATSYITAHL